MLNPLGDPAGSLDGIGRLLDLVARRQRLIASNIANQNTPGYKRRELQFEDALQSALGEAGDDAGRRTAALADATAKVEQVPGGPARPDGNDVLLEREITDLDRNTILFGALSRMARLELDRMRQAMETR